MSNGNVYFLPGAFSGHIEVTSDVGGDFYWWDIPENAAFWLRDLVLPVAQARSLLRCRERPASLKYCFDLNDAGYACVSARVTRAEACALVDGEDWRRVLGLITPLMVIPKEGERW